MAFSKTAKARVTQPSIVQGSWEELRSKSTTPQSFEIRKAAHVVLQQYDPKQYLLSHATIIASVDTEIPGLHLGSQMFDGMQIDRKYPDFYVTTGTQKFINSNCFVPGTAITMADGTVKNIELIQEGDLVLTHLGVSKKVTKTFCRDFSGDLLEIKFHGSTERLRVTDEHPLFVYKPVVNCVHCNASISRNNRSATFLLGKNYCSKYCYFKHRVKNKELLKSKKGEFVLAGDLTINDFLCTPVITGTKTSDLTPGKARLLGLFAAEGYYELDSRKDNSRVGVMWAFNKNETHTLAKLVVDLLYSEFGVEGVIRSHSRDNGIHVTTRTNRDLVTFFSRWVHGADSTTKFLDRDLLLSKKVIQQEVLRGWFEGDGCYIKTPYGSRLTGSSSSHSLSNQMQIMLNRLGISSYLTHSVIEGRKREVVDGVISITTDPTKSSQAWMVTCGSSWVAELVKGTIYEVDYNPDVQKSPKFRFLNGYETHIVNSIARTPYEGKLYNFDVKEDHSYIANGVAVHNCDAWERKLLLATYRSFIGGQSYLEHVQIPELSKGRIIDAAARDIGESIYVDILVATDRKHKELVSAITAGNISTLSMGCSALHTTCTKCGNVAIDETCLCRHIKYEKGSTFFDAKGIRRKVAELCGHYTDPKSVQFIEASWVANPAFKGAVLRSILDPQNAKLSETNRQKIQVAFSKPVQVPSSSLQKAARLAPVGVGSMAVPSDHLAYLYEGPSLGSLKTPASFSGQDSASAKRDSRLSILAQEDFPGQAEISEPKKETPESPFKKTVDDLYTTLVREVSQRVRKDLEQSETEKSREVLDENKSNQSLIKSALRFPKWQQRAKTVLTSVKNPQHAQSVLAGLILHDFGGWEAVAAANRFSGREILVIDRLLSRMTKKSSMAGDSRLYRVVIAVGGTAPYPDVNTYLATCREVMKSVPTESERAQLIEKGKLFALGL
jgi:intein/homing endonuclease